MPQIIILLSGKRKCGKDYISVKLLSIIGDDKAAIIRISEPVKSYYAQQHQLNLSELMSDKSYKERYRADMIIWSDQERDKDPGCFCKAAVEKAPEKTIWIISDVRRKTDIKWFNDTYGSKIKIVRISATDEIRAQRSWVFTTGVDDVTSECDLDDYDNWDLQVENNKAEDFEAGIQSILMLVKKATL